MLMLCHVFLPGDVHRVDCPNCYPDSDMQECNLVAVINQGRHLVRQETTPSEPPPEVSDDTRSVSLMAIQPVQDEDDILGWTIDRLRRQQTIGP